MVIDDGSCAWAALGFAGVIEGGWDNAAERGMARRSPRRKWNQAQRTASCGRGAD